MSEISVRVSCRQTGESRGPDLTPSKEIGNNLTCSAKFHRPFFTSVCLPFSSLVINIECMKGRNVQVQAFLHEDQYFILFFSCGEGNQQGTFSNCFSSDCLLFSPMNGVQGCAEYPRLALKESALTGLIFVAALIACDVVH